MEQNFISWNRKKKIVNMILLSFLLLIFILTSCKQDIFICSHKDSMCCTFKDNFFQVIHKLKNKCGENNIVINKEEYNIIFFSNKNDCSDSFVCVYKNDELLLYRKISEVCFFYKNSKEGKKVYRYFLSKIPPYQNIELNEIDEIDSKDEIELK